MKKTLLILATLSFVQATSSGAAYGQSDSLAPVVTIPVEQTAPSTVPEPPPAAQTANPNQPILPPELPARPAIPTPPAVTLLSPLNGGQIKDPLSWRAKAYKLRLEGNEAKGGIVRASRTVMASFEETLNALTAVCANQGITIDSIFESAGQVLAHMGEDKTGLIFSLKPLSKTSTQVRIGLDSETRTANDKTLDDLLLRVDSAINQKGIL